MLQVYDISTGKVTPVPSCYQLTEDRLMNVLSGHPMVRHVGGHTVLFVPGLSVEGSLWPGLLSVDLDDGGKQGVG